MLSHVAEELRGGTFLRFTKFLLSTNFMDKRVGRGKEYHDFLSNKFCVTVPKNFVGNHSLFHYFQESKKFEPMRGISRFSNESLLSHSTEKLRRETFLRSTKFLLSKKIMDKRVGGGEEYHVNLSVFFVSQYRKTS